MEYRIRVAAIIIPLLAVLVISGCGFQQKTDFSSIKNTTDAQIECVKDSECNQLDCSAPNVTDVKLELSGICEYNKCVCSCGDPENGLFCE